MIRLPAARCRPPCAHLYKGCSANSSGAMNDMVPQNWVIRISSGSSPWRKLLLSPKSATLIEFISPLSVIRMFSGAVGSGRGERNSEEGAQGAHIAHRPPLARMACTNPA